MTVETIYMSNIDVVQYLKPKAIGKLFRDTSLKLTDEI